MSLRLLPGLVAALPLFGAAIPASAAPAPKAVIELFTSQGCSSCPPADVVLGELVRRPDVIALSLPVDYWDYLGWKDTLAQPAFSARQRAYASARSDRQVYTPQMVLNGATPFVGSDRAALERLLAGDASLSVPVSLAESESSVTVDIGAAKAEPGTADVWLLPLVKAREVAIGRGENRNRSVTYYNVVRGMTRIGTWSGAALHLTVPIASARTGDAEAYVVLVQAGREGRPGPILGAAKSRDL